MFPPPMTAKQCHAAYYGEGMSNGGFNITVNDGKSDSLPISYSNDLYMHGPGLVKMGTQTSVFLSGHPETAGLWPDASAHAHARWAGNH